DIVDGDASPWATVYRWRPDYQADFAARMALSNGKRSSLTYPQIRYNGPDILRPGHVSNLHADSDPDAVLSWARYAEAGTYAGPVLLSPKGASCEVYLPSLVQTGTMHLIVTALGPSGLRRYCRIVLRVEA
ncbi:MAG TPA: hypothetical protein PKE04_13465, partial [Clostridia bacterium]|nr:hypothetical protein [Clostridia bacterium]